MPVGKEQTDAVRPAEVQILVDHGFEEVAPWDRPGKHLRETDLHLLERGGACSPRPDRRQGRRQPRRLAVEDGLHVGGPQLTADGLEPCRVGTPEEAIVETIKRDVVAPQSGSWT
jgi:hypothetical protein